MKRPVTLIVRRTRERAPWAPAGLLRAGVTLRNVAVETYNGFRADRGLDLAGSLSFATLLLAVPLLATFALLLAAFFQDNVAEIVDLANRILPFHATRVTENLREFIAESITISGIGLVVLLVSSIRLIFIVEGIFNAVWGAPRRRDWLPRIAIYSLVLLALALLVGAIGLGLRRLQRSTVGAALMGSPDAEHAFRFAVEWAALTLLYRFLPNAYVHWSAAAVAGGVISISLELLRGLFGLYVHALSSMNLITGYLTLILLFLFSVYLGWVLILLGVELTRAVQAHAGRPAAPPGRRAGRAENAIRMLLRLSEGKPHAFRELYDDQQGDASEAEEILKGLLAKRLIEGDPGRGYTLARPARRVTVAEVVDAVSPDLYTISPLAEDRVVLVLEPLFARLDKERRTMLGATLADLADR
jgi:YihY family inner membrane protein